MAQDLAAKAGSFMIGGDIRINRLGFGAMRITGAGVWGEPADRDEALRVLRRLPELGVNFIDTADSYGPDVSERLIRKALHPYDGVVVATKGGLARTGPGIWIPLGRPEYLIQQAHKSLRTLGLDQIPLWQLHRIDPKVPRDEQFGAIKSLIDQKIIRHAGLSEVSVDDIAAAMTFFKVASVQNRYNLADRGSDAVLSLCEREGIAFIPWFPLGAGELMKAGGALDEIARRRQATPSQIAIAWLLKRSPVMIPIPGTSKVGHLEQNMRAAEIVLSEEDFERLDAFGKAAGAR